MQIGAHWRDMATVTRNLERDGITPMAISAVGFVLWDLKGKILVPAGLCATPGVARAFTDLRQRRLHIVHAPSVMRATALLGGQRHSARENKVGHEPHEDPKRAASYLTSRQPNSRFPRSRDSLARLKCGVSAVETKRAHSVRCERSRLCRGCPTSSKLTLAPSQSLS